MKRKQQFRAELKEAVRIDKEVQEFYWDKKKRRKTVQIRIAEGWHAELKQLAASEELVLSRLLDVMCKHFFKNYVQ